jgi:hypothetical protein
MPGLSIDVERKRNVSGMSATQAASLCCIGSLWRSSYRASCFVAAGTACPIETPADAYTDPLATTYKTYQGYQEIFLDLAIADRRIHFENVNIYASAERAVKPRFSFVQYVFCFGLRRHFTVDLRSRINSLLQLCVIAVRARLPSTSLNKSQIK